VSIRVDPRFFFERTAKSSQAMLTLFLIGVAIAMIYFAIVWAISVRINNYGLLDVAWSYGVAVLAPLFALESPGPAFRKWPVALIGMAWSLRLGTYILLRVLRHHPKEDARYQTLRKSWKGPAMFLAFFELQAVMVALFALPFLYISFDISPALHHLTVAGAALAVLSLCGEATADLQMQHFKADPANAGKVCEAGLWRYSRHPNYFFESLIWWAFFIAALPSPHGWITIICPLLMLYFLFQVTGIPLTEEYSLKSKGDLYRAYQRTTSAFVPWFRKT
jgi:steroid 5-alpha reductase family enzyme